MSNVKIHKGVLIPGGNFQEHEVVLASDHLAALATLTEQRDRLLVLLQRCYDDPGVAMNDTELETMNELWSDVAAALQPAAPTDSSQDRGRN